MFKNILAKIRQVLAKLNLIKQVQTISDIADLPVDDSYYRLIDTWLCIYKGFYEDWHKVSYHTIDGPRHRNMETLKMAKVVSEEMARLVFNEKVNINISPDDYSDNIHNVLNDNQFYKLFQDHLEYMFGLGGMAIKSYAELDKMGAYKVKLCYTTADCFIPLSYTNDKINEGIFVNITRKGKYTYTLLEFHVWDGLDYIIRNELYKSENSHEIGVKVTLGTLYPDLEETVTIRGLTRPLFVYFKPNIANNIDLQSPLGIPLYANALDTLKSLDTAFDSFHREFRLGKKRIIVPVTAVKTIVDPTDGCVKRYFDASDETYVAFNFTDMENQKIIDNTVELRVDEHISAINALLDLLAMQTGFSSGSFTFDGQGVKTATEVISEESKTFRTKTSHEIVIEECLKDLITTIGEVAELYEIFSVPIEDIEISIDFDDSIVVDKEADKTYYLSLYTQKLTSKKYTLMKILKITEEEALQMIEEVNAEQQTMTGDIDTVFGGGG